jgi:hypothetical protein
MRFALLAPCWLTAPALQNTKPAASDGAIVSPLVRSTSWIVVPQVEVVRVGQDVVSRSLVLHEAVSGGGFLDDKSAQAVSSRDIASEAMFVPGDDESQGRGEDPRDGGLAVGEVP